MTGPSVPVEDFLEAIAAQLDATQDSLRMKAVTRPLTFALRDFNLDLKVFVEMGGDGKIRFRPGGPNETGASTVTVGFTTITRPMIEENTISIGMTQAPTLEEAGLEPKERVRLERLGVRNTAQLRELERSAGDNTLSRLSGVDVSRLRQALDMGRPRVDHATIETPRPPSPIGPANAERAESGRQAPALPLRPGARRIQLNGRNLVQGGRLPEARLDGVPLPLAELSEDRVAIDLPAQARAGVLSLTLPDGDVREFDLVPVGEPDHEPGSRRRDPWRPVDGGAR